MEVGNWGKKKETARALEAHVGGPEGWESRSSRAAYILSIGRGCTWCTQNGARQHALAYMYLFIGQNAS